MYRQPFFHERVLAHLITLMQIAAIVAVPCALLAGLAIWIATL